MGTSIRERAIALLAQNIQQSVVAGAVGVDDSYITQLLAEPLVVDEITQLRAKEVEKDLATDNEITEIKQLALKKIRSGLQFAKSPMEAARVFQILDNAKSRIRETSLGDNAGAQIVQITLPKNTQAVAIQLNAQNQVIDVAGRSMATLPSKALPALAAARKLQAPPAIADAQPKVAQTAKADPVVAAEKLEQVRSGALRDIATIIDGVAVVL